MGVNNSIHAQHWTENCGGMSACLQHNPLFSLTTSFWNMNILDWNSAHSLIKMSFLEQVWAECWQLLLNYEGTIRRNSLPHNCPQPFTTFLDMTWMKYSWHLTRKAWQRQNLLEACAFVMFFFEVIIDQLFISTFWSVPIITQIKWMIKKRKTYAIINRMGLNIDSDTKTAPQWVF